MICRAGQNAVRASDETSSTCETGETRSEFFPGICEPVTDSQSLGQQGGAASESLPLLSGLQQLCESLWLSKQPQAPAHTWPVRAKKSSSDVTHFSIRTLMMTARLGSVKTFSRLQAAILFRFLPSNLPVICDALTSNSIPGSHPDGQTADLRFPLFEKPCRRETSRNGPK